MKKEIWILIILAIIIVALIGLLLWPIKKIQAPVSEQLKTGLVITSLKAGDEVFSPLKITGYVNGDGWVGFEGQVGLVRLFVDGTMVTSAPLAVTTDWTKLPTYFEVNLNFKAPSYNSADLLFTNENPSGDPARDKTFTLPVKIK